MSVMNPLMSTGRRSGGKINAGMKNGQENGD
jgi:hypothetical protein